MAGSNNVTVNDLALAKAIPANRHTHSNAFFIDNLLLIEFDSLALSARPSNR
jgi:hypothetical protein